ncbi:Oidioi.mRNA.OKI2018_I69.chr2.g5354.t1.cds [Oikopleura dioica]|uniref:Oidioi.mRNA.OKI2018_I69.chr2.g5354.t1.cds n=1 Tax=Oikopleura dioica TaxID=34765 RepID=A0ABN7T0L8_OIKDI|nr:Oidioi.mRNA.OKI2018_I69.chr2.g5354.t1.cds [Oikopleura dioica]
MNILLIFFLEQILAQNGRVKRSATINCDIVNVDCTFLTMAITLNETCRAMEYPAVPRSGAGLYVTKSRDLKKDSILEELRDNCTFPLVPANGTAPGLPAIVACTEEIPDSSFVRTSAWLQFSPVNVNFEIKLMEPVELECYYNKTLNLDNERIEISDPVVSAVKEELQAAEIINNLGLSLVTSDDRDEREYDDGKMSEKSFFLGDTITVSVQMQKPNDFYWVYLKECDIKSGQKSLNIFNNFCPSKEFKDILSIKRKSFTSFSFILFKLDDVPSLEVKCNLAVLTIVDPMPPRCEESAGDSMYEGFYDYFNETDYYANYSNSSNSSNSEVEKSLNSLSLQSSIQILPHQNLIASGKRTCLSFSLQVTVFCLSVALSLF